MPLKSIVRCILRTETVDDYKSVLAKPIGTFSLQQELARHYETLSLHQDIAVSSTYPHMTVVDISPATKACLTESATFIVLPPVTSDEADDGAANTSCEITRVPVGHVHICISWSMHRDKCALTQALLDELLIDDGTFLRLGSRGLSTVVAATVGTDDVACYHDPSDGAQAPSLRLYASPDVYRNLRAAYFNSITSLCAAKHQYNNGEFTVPLDEFAIVETSSGDPAMCNTENASLCLTRVCVCPAVDDFVLTNLYGDAYADSLSFVLAACRGQLHGRVVAVGDVIALSVPHGAGSSGEAMSLDGPDVLEAMLSSTVHKAERWDCVWTAEKGSSARLFALRVCEVTSPSGADFGRVSLDGADTELVLVSQSRAHFADYTPLYPPSPVLYPDDLAVTKALRLALQGTLSTGGCGGGALSASQNRAVDVLVVHGIPENAPSAFTESALRAFGIPTICASMGALDADEMHTLLSGVLESTCSVALVLRGAEAFATECPHLFTMLEAQIGHGPMRIIVLVCESIEAVSPSIAARATNSFGVIECANPNEEDRKCYVQQQLERLTAALPVQQSLLLSLSALASWTVGLTYADLQAYLCDCAAVAFRCIDNSESGVRGVIDEAMCEEQLQVYMKAHGLNLVSTKLQPVRWSDVGGLEDAKRELKETIQLPLLHPELFASGGARRRRGILFYGPPGCGKTLLAKAVATEMNMNFMSVKGPELINQYVGESERNIRILFQRARDNAPCIVFFDELDALAPARGSKGDAGGAMDRIVSQLLVEVDGVGQTRSDGTASGDVFIIGATNRPDLLDPSLMRPGRFDRLCYLGIPSTRAEQLYALRALTRKFELADDVDLQALLHPLDYTYTGADFFALCSDAMMFSIDDALATVQADIAATRSGGCATGQINVTEEEDEKCSIRVCMRHFVKARDQLKPSVSREDLQRYEALRTKFSMT